MPWSKNYPPKKMIFLIRISGYLIFYSDVNLTSIFDNQPGFKT
jgi:hypothetical protein